MPKKAGACYVLFPSYGGKRDYAVWCRGAHGARVHPDCVRSVAAESEHLSRSLTVEEHAGHEAEAAVAVNCERYEDVPFRQEFANDGITVSFITIAPQSSPSSPPSHLDRPGLSPSSRQPDGPRDPMPVAASSIRFRFTYGGHGMSDDLQRLTIGWWWVPHR